MATAFQSLPTEIIERFLLYDPGKWILVCKRTNIIVCSPAFRANHIIYYLNLGSNDVTKVWPSLFVHSRHFTVGLLRRIHRLFDPESWRSIYYSLLKWCILYRGMEEMDFLLDNPGFEYSEDSNPFMDACCEGFSRIEGCAPELFLALIERGMLSNRDIHDTIVSWSRCMLRDVDTMSDTNAVRLIYWESTFRRILFDPAFAPIAITPRLDPVVTAFENFETDYDIELSLFDLSFLFCSTSPDIHFRVQKPVVTRWYDLGARQLLLATASLDPSNFAEVLGTLFNHTLTLPSSSHSDILALFIEAYAPHKSHTDIIIRNLIAEATIRTKPKTPPTLAPWLTSLCCLFDSRSALDPQQWLAALQSAAYYGCPDLIDHFLTAHPTLVSGPVLQDMLVLAVLGAHPCLVQHILSTTRLDAFALRRQPSWCITLDSPQGPLVHRVWFDGAVGMQVEYFDRGKGWDLKEEGRWGERNSEAARHVLKDAVTRGHTRATRVRFTSRFGEEGWAEEVIVVKM